MMPFTTDQFLTVFKEYNLAIWPLQIVFYLLGGLACLFALGRFKNGGRTVSALLSFLWLWNGIAYHILFFSGINRAAYLFGLLFIVQAILFVTAGVIKGRISYGPGPSGVRRALGLGAIAYASVAYPLLGAMAGHGFPFSPGFGVAPCPTTIFTFGLLLLAAKPVPLYLLAAPFAWSLIGSTAALSLGIVEDVGLIATGMTATAVLIARARALRGRLEIDRPHPHTYG